MPARSTDVIKEAHIKIGVIISSNDAEPAGTLYTMQAFVLDKRIKSKFS
jgi:hypothetical protein